MGLGPQCRSDNGFTARMRWHQSWYRAQVLGVECGVGPRRGSPGRYGNMLRAEDGARGLNFLTPAIHRLAEARLALGKGLVEPFRLRCNLLSSQPMCFNLFGHLALNLDLATRTLAALEPEVARVEGIWLEWAPQDALNHLGDRTAFDAFVVYRTRAGQAAFFGVETKLTEPFSQSEAFDGPRYRRWVQHPAAPWRPEAAGQLADLRHNQLWRNHLLAFAMLQQPEPQFAVGAPVVVGHPKDPGLPKTLEGYRALLRDPASLRDWPLDRLLEAATKAAQTKEDRAWAEGFKDRYLRLELSEG